MSFEVRFTAGARQDLERLFDFVLERELARPGGDPLLAGQAVAAIEAALGLLARSPFTCRKSASHPLLRELVIPFGHTGYLALFEIVDARRVWIAAVRHQREDDYL